MHVAFATLDGNVTMAPVLGTAGPEVGNGILIYIDSAGALMASRIDERAHRIIPGAIALGEKVTSVPGAVLTSFNASRSGTLAYANAFAAKQVVYVDRSGFASPAMEELAAFRRARVSPDGTRLALEKFDAGSDIWIYTISARTLTRLTRVAVSRIWRPQDASACASARIPALCQERRSRRSSSTCLACRHCAVAPSPVPNSPSSSARLYGGSGSEAAT
jgi:hypothetical protein